MRNNISCIILLFVFSHNAYAQHTRQASWQQKVDYKIDVALLPDSRMLEGQITITYHNYSPDALSEIYMHLWPNAYANNQTAFAKQHINNGKTGFWLADDELKGGIDSLNFTVDGKSVNWQLTDDIDIARIILKEPLKPGDIAIIHTPFKVRLPGQIFSRMGVENSIYCITQWYPKPAVYDINGWNPMPYLDQGEFYSEFGNFDVKITVPAHLIVAATGRLQNKEEYDWWIRKTQNHSAPHPYQSETKTLHFIQDSIHDFAWFANRNFYITRGEVWRNDNRTIETWLFSHQRDSNERRVGVNYINNAIRFYSDKVGEYPYTHATVVITPNKAGGGMEYPTITNCTSIDETTIIHEIGHNWFYGILATNERLHPWMDESINTYYETRFRQPKEKIPHYSRFLKTIKQQAGAFAIDDLFTPFQLSELLYNIEASKGTDQPGCMHAHHYSSTNYGSIVYAKNPKAFYYLQNYLGDELFDGMMQAYFEKWKFKHPLPDDFKEHVFAYTQKDLNWFFNTVLCSDTKIDFKIKGIQKRADSVDVTIKRTHPIPFPITGMIGDSVVFHQWFDTTNYVTIPNLSFTQIRIDGYEEMLDVNRNNNRIYTNGVFKKWNPTKPILLMDISSPYENRIFVTPIIGANMHNGFMLGAAFFNSVIPIKQTEYLLAPMYSFGSGDIAGYGEIKHSWITTGTFQRIISGVRFSRFAYNGTYYVSDISFEGMPYERAVFGKMNYEKIEPFITLKLRNPTPAKNKLSYINAKYNMLNTQKATKAILSNFSNYSSFLDIEYVTESKSALNESGFRTSYQLGNMEGAFQKISVEGSYLFSYGQPNKGLKVRGFAGIFLQNAGDTSTGIEYYRIGNNSSEFDYTFSQTQFGRGARFQTDNNIFANQLMFGDAQFHIIGFPISSTDSWLLATNFRTSLPGIIPLYLYADIAAINERMPVISVEGRSVQYTPKLYYTGGLAIVLFNEILQIHIPFIASNEITQYWDSQNIKFQQRINFSINLNKLAPIKALQSIKLY
jgi:hypothetical protein